MRKYISIIIIAVILNICLAGCGKLIYQKFNRLDKTVDNVHRQSAIKR